MLKTSLIAAAIFAAASLPAQARDTRSHSCGASGYDCPRDSYGDSGVNRYCPPGQIPHSFPNGDGIRCETPDGYSR